MGFNSAFKGLTQLINMHKHLMCCDGTADGVQHPEDAVNKHQNTEE